ncbi:PREDICTED: ABC transporter G family member 25-like [Tarenaya hassleriana]|uniref:ABC transporter G family member 25-like n=1 Tax=Tarenaya hassleriana TaxID=28532 RepID=UPI00053CA6C2|nr:PREDICTED: ABC transporter G family member 25-like [Tarenaya hassleriana]
MAGIDGEENQRDTCIIHCQDPSLSPSFPISLKFIDVSYKVKIHDSGGYSAGLKRLLGMGSTATVEERTILSGVTGMVSPGEILAVLGPSGSGKSTLLNAVAGRLRGPGLTGKILANDRKLTRQIIKRTGFVAQDDLLYTHLTVRETLVFCSLLRLPRTLTRAEKVRTAESVISELGLTKCENTVVGNSFIRGISGGERKRVSIAHELLVNPSLLVLDEPTSGLDATAAHRLVQTLVTVAHGKGKAVVTSVHQPSSRVFQMFDSVLLLSEGRCLYFGTGGDAVSYFETVGFSPVFPMNPADFLLDLANGICEVDGEGPNVRQTLVTAYDTLMAPEAKRSIEAAVALAHENPGFITGKERRLNLGKWFSQLSILLHRLFRERRHDSFDGLRVFQVAAASLLSGIMWWHSDYRHLHDRLGLLFFITIFWGVLPSVNAAFIFPQERAIFSRERASGMYTLSPYFMAHILGSLSMELVLPMAFLTLTYWMVDLKHGLSAFLLTLAVLLLYVVASQGLGLLFGAAIMDAKKASTIVTVTMLAFVLIGGYYVHKVPACMVWMKYVSTTFYSYRLLIDVQYGRGDEIFKAIGCWSEGRRRFDGQCRFVEDEVVADIGPWKSVGVLLLMIAGYRVLAYLALKRIKH